MDGKGGYGWGGADGTQFIIDRSNNLIAIFMTQTDWYRAPTYDAAPAAGVQAAGIETRRQWDRQEVQGMDGFSHQPAAGLALLIGCSFAQQQPAGQINAEQRFRRWTATATTSSPAGTARRVVRAAGYQQG